MWIKDHFLCIKKVRIEGVEIFPVGFVGACTFQSYVICYMLYVTLEPFFSFDKDKNCMHLMILLLLNSVIESSDDDMAMDNLMTERSDTEVRRIGICGKLHQQLFPFDNC